MMNNNPLEHKQSHKCLEIYSDLQLPLRIFKDSLHAAVCLKGFKFNLVVSYFLQSNEENVLIKS